MNEDEAREIGRRYGENEADRRGEEGKEREARIAACIKHAIFYYIERPQLVDQDQRRHRQKKEK